VLSESILARIGYRGDRLPIFLDFCPLIRVRRPALRRAGVILPMSCAWRSQQTFGLDDFPAFNFTRYRPPDPFSTPSPLLCIRSSWCVRVAVPARHCGVPNRPSGFLLGQDFRLTSPFFLSTAGSTFGLGSRFTPPTFLAALPQRVLRSLASSPCQGHVLSPRVPTPTSPISLLHSQDFFAIPKRCDDLLLFDFFGSSWAPLSHAIPLSALLLTPDITSPTDPRCCP